MPAAHSSGGPLSAAFLMWDPAKVPARLQPVTDDHIRMHRILQDSGLDCVSVMPPHIAGVCRGWGGGGQRWGPPC